MRTQLLLTAAAVLTLATLAACGGSSPPPANDPGAGTTSSSTGISGNVGPAAPGNPTGTTQSGDSRPTSGAPASPMEGKCKPGDMPPQAKDLDACVKGCQGLDETVPPGSRCVPAKTQCAMNCRTKFSQP